MNKALRKPTFGRILGLAWLAIGAILNLQFVFYFWKSQMSSLVGPAVDFAFGMVLWSSLMAGGYGIWCTKKWGGIMLGVILPVVGWVMFSRMTFCIFKGPQVPLAAAHAAVVGLALYTWPRCLTGSILKTRRETQSLE